MTLREFEEKVVDSVFMGENQNGLQLMSLTTKDGTVHNFFLPCQNMELCSEAH